MQFCPKCKAIMMPKLVNKKKVVACSCGYVDRKAESGPLVEKVAQEEILIVSEDNMTHPVVTAKCPECNHTQAYHWSKQTRAGDEPETRFYKCLKCKHTWRDYS